MDIRRIRFGVSSKFEFGRWQHDIAGPFETEAEAYKWLNTEEYDFRERELVSKTALIKWLGMARYKKHMEMQDELMKYGWH